MKHLLAVMVSRVVSPAARAALAAALVVPFASAQDLLVQASRIVIAPDTVLTDGQLLVRQGKIAYVGSDIPAEARARATVVDYGQAWIVPGFVLASGQLGQERDLAEGSLAFTPDLRAAEAFDPWQEELQALGTFGITALGLSPSPRNVAAGLAALVKPGSSRKDAKQGGQLAAPELQLVLSLTEAARNQEREPTSLMGAKDLLRQTFTAAGSATQGGPDLAVLRQVLGGTRRVFVHADTFAELSAALDLARDFRFEPVLVGAREAEKVLGRLVQQKAGIVLGTLSPEARLQQLRLPGQLAQAGVPFCFGGRPDQLRLSAVLAVRAGLDRTTALQALTRMPALLLDQQATIGSLRQDHAADFAVFTGDPLDLDARHLGTWVAGVRVHGEAPKPTKPAATPSSTAAAGAR